MRPRAIVFVSAITAIIVSLGVWTIAQVHATLLANQTAYRRTGNRPYLAGSSVSATDLNGNFDAVVTVVDGNIDRSNMPSSVSGGISVAWAVVQSPCTASPCTRDDNLGISSITRSAAGTYTATLSTARSNSAFAAVTSAGNSALTCSAEAASTSTVAIVCFNGSAVATDSDFSIVVFDN